MSSCVDVPVSMLFDLVALNVGFLLSWSKCGLLSLSTLVKFVEFELCPDVKCLSPSG